MNVNSISNSLNFKAGKVQIYSDFDGTYLPVSHALLRENSCNKDFMNSYCSKMNKFFKKNQGDIFFHITTGRTFGEYKAVSELLKERNFTLHLPDSFIAKNGSDEYVKNGTDNDFYKNGRFPYGYNNPNQIKENEIKNSTNWDGVKIKDFIKNLAQKYNLKIAEADSENSVRDYGNNSLFSNGKLNPNEWKKLPRTDITFAEHDVPVADFVMGVRKDGNLKISLFFPPDYGHCPERNQIYDSFISEIKSFLDSENIKYNAKLKDQTPHNKYFRNFNICPNVDGKNLTKLYDTHNALKSAIVNNDMLIVAGNGTNDFDMLNPLEYISKKEWEEFARNGNCKNFYSADMNTKLSMLKEVYNGKNSVLEKELKDNGFLKKIESLPLYSIIIKEENSGLDILYDVFGKTGKVIEVEHGNLSEGIKQAVKTHSQKEKEFSDKMSARLKNVILPNSRKIVYSVTGLVSALAIVLLGIWRKNKDGIAAVKRNINA